MTVFWVFGGVAGVCLIIILGAVPELLAGALTAACILTPYYSLHEREAMTEELRIELRDGKPYIANDMPPEHVQISHELWDKAEPYDPEVDADTGLAPGYLWVETIPHAGAEVKDAAGTVIVPERDNDGYVLHVDAENMSASYRVAAVPLEGPILGTLAGWGFRE